MREIKFRGKNSFNDRWEYGSLVKENDGDLWIFPDGEQHRSEGGNFSAALVDPETVGQYTGLKDKKGREIYEGDIVVTIAHGCRYVEQVLWYENLLGGGYSFSFVGQGCGPACHKQDTMEVIGNIHDNPELLKT